MSLTYRLLSFLSSHSSIPRLSSTSTQLSSKMSSSLSSPILPQMSAYLGKWSSSHELSKNFSVINRMVSILFLVSSYLSSINFFYRLLFLFLLVQSFLLSHLFPSSLRTLVFPPPQFSSTSSSPSFSLFSMLPLPYSIKPKSNFVSHLSHESSQFSSPSSLLQTSQPSSAEKRELWTNDYSSLFSFFFPSHRLSLSSIFLYADAQVIGIDYGSELFKAAVVAPGKAMEIILNAASKRKTSSSLSYAEDDKRTIGDDAMGQMIRKPRSVFFFLNKFLGFNVFYGNYNNRKFLSFMYDNIYLYRRKKYNFINNINNEIYNIKRSIKKDERKLSYLKKKKEEVKENKDKNGEGDEDKSKAENNNNDSEPVVSKIDNEVQKIEKRMKEKHTKISELKKKKKNYHIYIDDQNNNENNKSDDNEKKGHDDENSDKSTGKKNVSIKMKYDGMRPSLYPDAFYPYNINLNLDREVIYFDVENKYRKKTYIDDKQEEKQQKKISDGEDTKEEGEKNADDSSLSSNVIGDVDKSDGNDNKSVISLSPELMNSQILSYIRSMSNKYINTDKDKALGCVVSIPCGYNQRQRQSLVDAIEISGLTAIGLIHNTATAATQHALDLSSSYTTIKLFLDIGSSGVEAGIAQFGPKLSTDITDDEITSNGNDDGDGNKQGGDDNSKNQNEEGKEGNVKTNNEEKKKKKDEVMNIHMLGCSRKNGRGGHLVDLILANDMKNQFEKNVIKKKLYDDIELAQKNPDFNANYFPGIYKHIDNKEKFNKLLAEFSKNYENSEINNNETHDNQKKWLSLFSVKEQDYINDDIVLADENENNKDDSIFFWMSQPNLYYNYDRIISNEEKRNKSEARDITGDDSINEDTDSLYEDFHDNDDAMDKNGEEKKKKKEEENSNSNNILNIDNINEEDNIDDIDDELFVNDRLYRKNLVEVMQLKKKYEEKQMKKSNTHDAFGGEMSKEGDYEEYMKEVHQILAKNENERKKEEEIIRNNIEEYKKEHPIEDDGGKTNNEEKEKDLKAVKKLLKQSTVAKHVLSANKKVHYRIESLYNDLDYKEEIDRESNVENYIKRYKILDDIYFVISDVLRKANLNIHDIDHVELLGGAWRVPFIQQEISSYVNSLKKTTIKNKRNEKHILRRKKQMKLMQIEEEEKLKAQNEKEKKNKNKNSDKNNSDNNSGGENTSTTTTTTTIAAGTDGDTKADDHNDQESKETDKENFIGQHLNGDEAFATGAAFIAANSTITFRARKMILVDTSEYMYSLNIYTNTTKVHHEDYFSEKYGNSGRKAKNDSDNSLNTDNDEKAQVAEEMDKNEKEEKKNEHTNTKTDASDNDEENYDEFFYKDVHLDGNEDYVIEKKRRILISRSSRLGGTKTIVIRTNQDFVVQLYEERKLLNIYKIKNIDRYYSKYIEEFYGNKRKLIERLRQYNYLKTDDKNNPNENNETANEKEEGKGQKNFFDYEDFNEEGKQLLKNYDAVLSMPKISISFRINLAGLIQVEKIIMNIDFPNVTEDIIRDNAQKNNVPNNDNSTERRVYRIMKEPLTLTLEYRTIYTSPVPLSLDEKKKERKTLLELEKIDDEFERHSEVLNQLESLIYSSRALVNEIHEDIFLKKRKKKKSDGNKSNEDDNQNQKEEQNTGKEKDTSDDNEYEDFDEKQVLMAYLEECEDWLYDDKGGRNMSTEAINKRRKEILNRIKPLEFKNDEYQSRPKVIEKMERILKDIPSRIEQIKTIKKYINNSDIDFLFKEREAITNWWKNIKKQQNELPLSDMPVLTKSVVFDKIKHLTQIIKKIENTPKPKPPPNQQQKQQDKGANPHEGASKGADDAADKNSATKEKNEEAPAAETQQKKENEMNNNDNPEGEPVNAPSHKEEL